MSYIKESPRLNFTTALLLTQKCAKPKPGLAQFASQFLKSTSS